jgi:imidazolonepropionase-like amidohydrolase
VRPSAVRNEQYLKDVLVYASLQEVATAMATPYTIHTSVLFDPKQKAFVENVSITVDPISGLITEVVQRPSGSLDNALATEDVDLRGKIVMPGFVDAHTHIFLHSYE